MRRGPACGHSGDGLAAQEGKGGAESASLHEPQPRACGDDALEFTAPSLKGLALLFQVVPAIVDPAHISIHVGKHAVNDESRDTEPAHAGCGCPSEIVWTEVGDLSFDLGDDTEADPTGASAFQHVASPRGLDGSLRL